jgi:hypothetical protein
MDRDLEGKLTNEFNFPPPPYIDHDFSLAVDKKIVDMMRTVNGR